MTDTVFLTGRPGIGKTTAVKRIVERLRDAEVSVAGFWTEEVRKDGVREGFDIVTVDGRRTPLARKGEEGDAKVASYGVFVDHVADVSRRLADDLDDLPADAVVVIDEIGKMELLADAFKGLVEKALDAPPRLVATVKAQKDPFTRDLPDEDDGAVWTEVTKEDRDDVPGRVVDRILG